FFFSSRRRHTRSKRDWSSDVCSSDLLSDLALLGIGVVNQRILLWFLCVNRKPLPCPVKRVVVRLRIQDILNLLARKIFNIDLPVLVSELVQCQYVNSTCFHQVLRPLLQDRLRNNQRVIVPRQTPKRPQEMLLRLTE